MLWLFLVVRNTLGEGFGTYLDGTVRKGTKYMCNRDTYQAASTSSAVKNLIKACRIYGVNDEMDDMIFANDSRARPPLQK